MEKHGFSSPLPYYQGTPRDDFLGGSDVTLKPVRAPLPDSLQTQKKRLPGRWVRFSGVLRRFWVLEVLWFIVGLGCAATIIAVLAQYNGQKAPE